MSNIKEIGTAAVKQQDAKLCQNFIPPQKRPQLLSNYETHGAKNLKSSYKIWIFEICPYEICTKTEMVERGLDME